MDKIEKKIYERLLELEDEGKIGCEISYRGGNYGLTPKEALELVQELLPKTPALILDNMEYFEARLPRRFGAYCNYLGGGIRAAIGKSDFDDELWEEYPKVAQLLDKLAEVCAIRYEELENECGLNDGCYPDGDTNWDALATAKVRRTGITSYSGL